MIAVHSVKQRIPYQSWVWSTVVSFFVAQSKVFSRVGKTAPHFLVIITGPESVGHKPLFDMSIKRCPQCEYNTNNEDDYAINKPLCVETELPQTDQIQPEFPLNRIEQNDSRAREKARIKKMLPNILIPLFFCLIGYWGANMYKQNHLNKEYEQKVQHFTLSLSKADNVRINQLHDASDLFIEILNLEKRIDRKDSPRLRENFNTKANAIINELQTLIGESERTEKTDPTGSSILADAKRKLAQIEEYKNKVNSKP